MPSRLLHKKQIKSEKFNSMVNEILKELELSPELIFLLFDGEGGRSEYFKQLVKEFMDPLADKYSVLDEVYTEGLDAVQVFGQARLIIDGARMSLMDKISGMEFPQQEGDSSEEGDDIESLGVDDEVDDKDEDVSSGAESEVDDYEDVEHSEQEQSDEDQNEIDEQAEEDTPLENPAFAKDAFGLNDGFFDIDQFNKQIVAMEEPNEVGDEEEIDYFGELPSDSEEEMDYYDDVFEKPEDLEQEGEEEDDEEEEEDFDLLEEAVGSARQDLFADEKPEQPEQLSTFEKHQRELQEQIRALEQELVAEKKWTMKGEATARDRPADSLLDDPEVDLEFDRTARPVPVITEEVTESLEDVIKRRIKTEEFDDLPRRLVADTAKFYDKNKYELSQEKGTKSLADIYEDEYNKVDPNQEVNEELKYQHDEVTKLFSMINYKLNALTSASFVPMPHQAKSIDIKVTDVAPVISTESAQPLHLTSESALAPQEIYKVGSKRSRAQTTGDQPQSTIQLKSGLSYSKDELSREDKQRLRRAAKRKRARNNTDVKPEVKSSQPKKQKNQDAIDTLSRAKNVSIIDKKGNLRDIKGQLKKDTNNTSNNLKL